MLPNGDLQLEHRLGENVCLEIADLGIMLCGGTSPMPARCLV